MVQQGLWIYLTHLHLFIMLFDNYIILYYKNLKPWDYLVTEMPGYDGSHGHFNLTFSLILLIVGIMTLLPAPKKQP